jgi:hypothetical protein
MSLSKKIKTVCLVVMAFSFLIFTTAIAQEEPTSQINLPPAYIVPNFHPASCDWLNIWSTERNYCVNSYLNHLDRVRDDANYTFVLSGGNNMKSDNASVTSCLPQSSAALTDFLSKNPQRLAEKGSNTFAVRPQQIITMRPKTQSKVEYLKPLLTWDEMVPPAKRAALNSYQGDKKDHPPRGN